MKQDLNDRPRLSDAELLQLKRWNTPTIYNGWEQITRHDAGRDGFNLEEARDFMPQMGPMVGYAVTVVFEPSNPAHRRNDPAPGASIAPMSAACRARRSSWCRTSTSRR